MKRAVFVVVICFLFAIPLFTATPVNAGHTVTGNRSYCSPCTIGGECVCDDGELPGGGLVTERPRAIARPESKGLTVVAITLLLAWLGLRFRA